MTTQFQPDAEHAISAAECWRYLRGAEVGRLAVVIDGAPDIFPVNFVADRGSVVFRTDKGSKLRAVLTGAPVAFEADGIDPDTSQAWSVVLKGSGALIRRLTDVIDSAALPLSPWHDSPKNAFVRIEPDHLTGRRFKVVATGRWRSGFADAPHASME